MTHAMLTPGKNDDGLGIFISADGRRFGHDGADEGFQSSLTAFIEGGEGIVILTNSDNGGRLASELQLTIARAYGWSGFPQTEKTVVHLSEADTARLLGHYRIDVGGGGELEIVAQRGRVLVRAATMPERELLAESPTQLFLRDDGTPIEVTTVNGSVGLTIGGGLHAIKVQ
jgi:hypothetical protein